MHETARTDVDADEINEDAPAPPGATLPAEMSRPAYETRGSESIADATQSSYGLYGGGAGMAKGGMVNKRPAKPKATKKGLASKRK